jgi:hypothetical protein
VLTTHTIRPRIHGSTQLAGRKKNLDWRLATAERAAASGIKHINIGARLGLALRGARSQRQAARDAGISAGVGGNGGLFDLFHFGLCNTVHGPRSEDFQIALIKHVAMSVA